MTCTICQVAILLAKSDTEASEFLLQTALMERTQRAKVPVPPCRASAAGRSDPAVSFSTHKDIS